MEWLPEHEYIQPEPTPLMAFETDAEMMYTLLIQSAERLTCHAMDFAYRRSFFCKNELPRYCRNMKWLCLFELLSFATRQIIPQQTVHGTLYLFQHFVRTHTEVRPHIQCKLLYDHLL